MTPERARVLANIMTFSRALLGMVTAVTLINGHPELAFGIGLISTLTDLDGTVVRKYKAPFQPGASEWDGLADLILVFPTIASGGVWILSIFKPDFLIPFGVICSGLGVIGTWSIYNYESRLAKRMQTGV